ncbi:nucleotidyl transferase AbiEii/AbiGii toxin family protein [Candidatus Gottesmanbacteria bacterium]|nr:nucleotidyl transferase AbiEii/AbiGii toxin family protein [Candidatus Gottesmanbacteria bacterium]
MFTDTLPKEAQHALVLLGQNTCLPPDTYLARGSALALHFGHRISVDFDFFTPKSFNSEKIALDLAKIGKFEADTIIKDTLLGSFEKTRFSLFRYVYPLLFPTNHFSDILLADPRDIAAMKLAAIMDRGTKKDFVDLYFILKQVASMEDCLKFYDKKYQALSNNIYSIITSLSYFTDAHITEMPKMLKLTNWSDVEKFFTDLSIKLAKKYL